MSTPRDRGSASLEAAITFPALLLIGLFLFAAMQVMTARSQVQAAARAGARAAITGSNTADATTRAKKAVAVTLSQGSVCKVIVPKEGGLKSWPPKDDESPKVVVSGFGPGQATTVTVSCQIDTTFGVLGERSTTASATEFVSDIRGGVG